MGREPTSYVVNQNVICECVVPGLCQWDVNPPVML